MAISYIKHDVFPENILIRKFYNTVSAEDIIESWKYLCDNNLISKNIKGVINDLEDCELNMNMESFSKVLIYMKQTRELKKIKLAVITNIPKQIIFPSYGELQEKALMIRPFSSMNAAVNWIMI